MIVGCGLIADAERMCVQRAAPECTHDRRTDEQTDDPYADDELTGKIGGRNEG